MIIPYYCEDYPEDPPEYRPVEEKRESKSPSLSGIKPLASRAVSLSKESESSGIADSRSASFQDTGQNCE